MISWHLYTVADIFSKNIRVLPCLTLESVQVSTLECIDLKIAFIRHSRPYCQAWEISVALSQTIKILIGQFTEYGVFLAVQLTFYQTN